MVDELRWPGVVTVEEEEEGVFCFEPTSSIKHCGQKISVCAVSRIMRLLEEW